MGIAAHIQPGSPVDRAGAIFQREIRRAHNEVQCQLIPVQFVLVVVRLRDVVSGIEVEVIIENPDAIGEQKG